MWFPFLAPSKILKHRHAPFVPCRRLCRSRVASLDGSNELKSTGQARGSRQRERPSGPPVALSFLLPVFVVFFLIWLWLSKPMVPLWGRRTTHFRTYFSGDWDAHWGYGSLIHGHTWFAFGLIPKGKPPSSGLFSFGVGGLDQKKWVFRSPSRPSFPW